MMNNIQEKLLKIRDEIDTQKVRIIAVSKYVGIDEIIQAYEAGIRDFGENKVNDAEEKRSRLPEEINKNITWHLIGHLQTNKVKKAVGNFEYIHSVDSLRLAEKISEEAQSKRVLQKILIQVNISEENTKFGFGTKEAKEVFKKILSLNSINIAGLMTMAPYTADDKILHSTFKGLKELRDYLQNELNCSLPELSMGMSNDYKIAVREGSTMIRLGQVLFK